MKLKNKIGLELHLGEEVLNNAFVGPEIARPTLEDHAGEAEVLNDTDLHFPMDGFVASPVGALEQADPRIEKGDPVISEHTIDFMEHINRVFCRGGFHVENGYWK